MIARRGLLKGLCGVLFAPAIVRASALMQISVQRETALFEWSSVAIREDLADIIQNVTPIDTPFMRVFALCSEPQMVSWSYFNEPADWSPA